MDLNFLDPFSLAGSMPLASTNSTAAAAADAAAAASAAPLAAFSLAAPVPQSDSRKRRPEAATAATTGIAGMEPASKRDTLAIVFPLELSAQDVTASFLQSQQLQSVWLWILIPCFSFSQFL